MYRPFRLRLSHTASVFKNTAAWNFKNIFILLVGAAAVSCAARKACFLSRCLSRKEGWEGGGEMKEGAGSPGGG